MDKNTEQKPVQTPAPVRPLCLRLEDAKAEIFSIVNLTAKKHDIPFFLIEPIITEAARQVRECAAKEREAAASTYERQIAEYNKRGENNE